MEGLRKPFFCYSVQTPEARRYYCLLSLEGTCYILNINIQFRNVDVISF